MPGRGPAYYLFRLPAPAQTFLYLRALLTSEEAGRAARFVRPEDRYRSISSRGAVRHLLGLATGVPGNQVVLADTPLGRPVAEGGPEFNVSHSRTSLLIGISWSGRVGVDVEYLRDPDSEFLLTAMTEREREQDRRIGAFDRQWFRYLLWTRKEAASKAAGVGLRQSPADCDVLDSVLPGGLALGSLLLEDAAVSFADEGDTPRQFIAVDWR